MVKDSDPYIEGFDAAIVGRDAEDCPYEFGSEDEKLWMLGFKDGNADPEN